MLPSSGTRSPHRQKSTSCLETAGRIRCLCPGHADRSGIGARICNCQLRHRTLQGHTGTRSLLLTLLQGSSCQQGVEKGVGSVSSLSAAQARCSLPACSHATHALIAAERNLSESKNSPKKGPVLTLLSRFKKLHVGFDFKVDRKKLKMESNLQKCSRRISAATQVVQHAQLGRLISMQAAWHEIPLKGPVVP